MTIRFLPLLVLLVTPVMTTAQDEGDKDTTKGRLFEVLADYTSDLTDFQNKRHAFVARGTRSELSGNGVKETKVFFLGAVEDYDNQYAASSFESPSRGRIFENWQQRLVLEGKTKYRLHHWSEQQATKYDGEDDDEKVKDAIKKLRFGAMYPFELSGSAPQVLRDGNGTRKRGAFLTKLPTADLELGKYDKDGNLFGHWIFPSPEIEFQAELTFSKKDRWKPTNCRFFTRAVDVNEKNRRLYGEVDTTWGLSNGTHVPTTFHLTMFGINGERETHYDLELSWLVGNKMPKKFLPEETNEDWRKPFQEAFDAQWQRRGVVPPFISQK